jgi:RNA dependent RNA polymerase
VNPFDEGIKLCLRDSMKKFESPDSEALTIEVARAFVGPSKMYLNRFVVGNLLSIHWF